MTRYARPGEPPKPCVAMDKMTAIDQERARLRSYEPVERTGCGSHHPRAVSPCRRVAVSPCRRVAMRPSRRHRGPAAPACETVAWDARVWMRIRMRVGMSMSMSMSMSMRQEQARKTRGRGRGRQELQPWRRCTKT